ncbi:MAG: nucleoside hydrolase [Lachnospiraceae bacterium]
MWNYNYTVPEQKKIRLIIHTDCANEADDQYAVAHQLMTPKFDVRGIIAGHFDFATSFPGARLQPGETAKASYREIEQVLDAMGLKAGIPIYLGAGEKLADERTPLISEGAKFIIEEAMREDSRPLFIGCQGSITDLASAILIEPGICERMTAIWIGGGDYPNGGFEFNLMQDIHAANIVFSSSMPLWQIPMKVYKSLSVSLAELQYKVAPCGAIGKYLFDQLVACNDAYAMIEQWPHGELWGLGDQGVIAVLMQESERVDNFFIRRAPGVDLQTMQYIDCDHNREIRVYESIDYRLTLEDFFAKLAINYGDSDC